MKYRNIEIENMIRNCLLIKIDINFEFYSSNEINQSENIVLHFKRSNNSQFKLRLYKIKKLEMFINNISGEYIGNLKCIQYESTIILCLDPYDDNILDVTDKDNMVIEFEEYINEEI